MCSVHQSAYIEIRNGISQLNKQLLWILGTRPSDDLELNKDYEKSNFKFSYT